jgi:sigma-B regulation protein RsbU (phosphoserine phosphatase)
MESARLVQRKLFPQRLPSVPGWDFAGDCRPAQSVGGDYYDLFAVGPGRVALALGDVTGKGLGPALVMAHLHALVRGRLSGCPADLPRFAADLNEYLAEFLPSDFFVTLFVAVLETATGWLHYVNAGHPAPLLLDRTAAAPVGLAEGGTPLGVLPGARYEAGQAQMGPGAVLTLFSDGLTEAYSPGGEMLRAWRVAEVLRGGRTRTADEILTALREEVESFTGRANPEDDLTLVVVRRVVDGSSRSPRASLTLLRPG